jgi:hypothetical protein
MTILLNGYNKWIYFLNGNELNLLFYHFFLGDL